MQESKLLKSTLSQPAHPYAYGTGGGRGGSCPPPQKRLQSRKVGKMFNKSRAKSGKLKSQKLPKSPQFVGQTKAVGQYSVHSRAILAYYKKNWDKLCEFCDKFSDVWKTCLMFRKILYVWKNFWTPKMVHCPKFFWRRGGGGGGGLVGQNPKKSGKFFSAPPNFFLPVRPCAHPITYIYMNLRLQLNSWPL